VSEVKKVLFLLVVFVIVSGLILKGTFGYFSDDETSAGSTFSAWQIVTVTLLNDGFEGDPWDDKWDANGTIDWVQTSGEYHSGSYSALFHKDDTSLTSDDLDASRAASITVSFWFRPHDLQAGSMFVQLYDGTTYDSWYNLMDYPGTQKDTWCYFSEDVTDSQYFRSDFRLRFDGSGLGKDFWLDDVLITIEQ